MYGTIAGLYILHKILVIFFSPSNIFFSRGCNAKYKSLYYWEEKIFSEFQHSVLWPFHGLLTILPWSHRSGEAIIWERFCLVRRFFQGRSIYGRSITRSVQGRTISWSFQSVSIQRSIWPKINKSILFTSSTATIE